MWDLVQIHCMVTMWVYIMHSGHLSIDQAFSGSHKEVAYVKGMENPSEASWNCIRWLVGHGYSDGEIEKVIGENVLRVLRTVWAL